MGQRGRWRAEERFDAAANSRALLACVEQVAASRGRAAGRSSLPQSEYRTVDRTPKYLKAR
jgi:hypothetical protein